MDWRERALGLWQQGRSWTEIARVLRKEHFAELTEQQVREKVRTYIRATNEYRVKQDQHTDKSPATVVYNQDGTVTKQRIIALTEGEDLTPDLLLQLHGFDPLAWQIKSCTNNYYQTQRKGGNVMVLYQSKLIAEPQKGPALDFVRLEKWFSGLKGRKPANCKPAKNRTGLLVEVNIADLHYGKYADERETGNAYSHEDAARRFARAIDEIVDKFAGRPVEKILLPIGNDFFHVDNAHGTTTKGTPQTCSGRWQPMFEGGAELMIWGIERLLTIAPVDCFYLRSNHDEVMAYCLTCLLKAHFAGCDAVKVDTNPQPRKYREHGKTLIGFTHGDSDSKMLPTLMQVEAREAWGRTDFHEFHAAHLHKETVATSEDGGLILRRVASLTGTDAWHKQSGYVGAVRKSQTFVYDREKGLIEVHHTVL